MVNKTLAEELAGGIHALALHTLTPDGPAKPTAPTRIAVDAPEFMHLVHLAHALGQD